MTEATQDSSSELAIPERLRRHARELPDKKALIYADGERGGRVVYSHRTYREIDHESDAYAAGFSDLGIGQGTKTILMLRPAPELFAVVFGLLKIGAVPVMVDPGMGVRRMLHCYRTVGAEAFIGIPEAHAVRVLNRTTFSSVKVNVTAGSRWFWNGPSLRDLAARRCTPPYTAMVPDDLLAINFTTGSTGAPKGVEYTHGMLDAMLRQIIDTHGHGSDHVSLVTLPLFGIFDLLLGATAVLPPVNPTKVAKADPQVLVEAINRFGVSTMFASPALLARLSSHTRDNGLQLSNLRCVVSGGAPVDDAIVASMLETLGPPVNNRFFATYGATEALPIAAIDAAEIVAGTRVKTHEGSGTCVGRPVTGVEATVVRVTEDPLPEWSDGLVVDRGEVGEITLSGSSVSRRYHAPLHANAFAKIRQGDRVWHRTGDLGWIDEDNRIWFCGRKSERVYTVSGPLDTARCEGILNAHPDVHRTALVGIGERQRQTPVICVELRPELSDDEQRRVRRELRAIAQRHAMTSGIDHFLFPPKFPVDIRHNAKINRRALASWAERQISPAGRSTRRDRVLCAVPVAGWLFLLYGVVRPYRAPLLRKLFWVDAFLSVIVHSAQIPLALRRARKAGFTRTSVVWRTLLYGATWWRSLPPRADSGRKGEHG
ncbi:peptide synthase [Longimycelium tulufanense]|uniref:Peptide synthase n=1 Tax=Longimycelium tulufanense TaxID=907463 RepID=A0A8J3FUM8_9PSEU|nr:fatty acid CoA ligase family protein [Longimycelium tulufanense]GGM60063.1 peptide synthase [Longimycelium tulufanense]